MCNVTPLCVRWINWFWIPAQSDGCQFESSHGKIYCHFRQHLGWHILRSTTPRYRVWILASCFRSLFASLCDTTIYHPVDSDPGPRYTQCPPSARVSHASANRIRNLHIAYGMLAGWHALAHKYHCKIINCMRCTAAFRMDWPIAVAIFSRHFAALACSVSVGRGPLMSFCRAGAACASLTSSPY